ncbi:MAG: ParB/RepB/Spo0J family partition protein, partial [bacterium]
AAEFPMGVAVVPLENIHPGRLQPRTTISAQLVRELAASMRGGRHDPLLEVEPAPQRPGHYQIVCGEQRWRAAREAGVERVLVRVLRDLNYVTRLQKQYEENRLRADLTPSDDAHLVLSLKRLKDIEAAERLLSESGVRFQPLADKTVKEPGDIEEHLESLKKLLLEHNIHVIKTDAGPLVRPLSPWRETEKALAISEVARKRKLAVLRLEPDVMADVNDLPANHAQLIAQVEGHERRMELAEQARYLTNRQLNAAVRRLRIGDSLTVAAALEQSRQGQLDPLAFESQLQLLADLCRQIARLLGNLGPRISAPEREQVRAALAGLIEIVHAFEEAA